ncbi:MAG: hypothetical protein N838_23205 [Thiohalocapsa sp. PB-PSB1]|jgi:peptidoglycan hydrolase-like protein with peptidoglycan-binding domain|nr:MAG: hypothetical protein N838_23205 [Thiohalocapsa sp. PB-PSB1]
MMLLAQGFYNGTVDGVDGPMTRAAIASFRAHHKLPVAAGVDWQFLQQLGLSSVVVRRVQEALQTSGHYSGATTGEMDAATEAAILRYRVDRGLPAIRDIDDPLLISLGITA